MLPAQAGGITILGASARAAAFSALRAGLQPICCDLFADRDLRAVCPVERIERADYPKGFADFLRRTPDQPWMYTGALENYPAVVRRLADIRPLWGNRPNTLSAVRSPVTLALTLRERDIPCPDVRMTVPRPDPGKNWLQKPLRSAGGMGVRPWDPETDGDGRCYFQQFVTGDPCAAVYLADGHSAQLLGVTHQLVGASWLHAPGFQYGGSIGLLSLSAEERGRFEAIGNVLADAFHLRGLFGVDAVRKDGVPWPVEVNPRYPASAEIWDFATGRSAVALHCAAFSSAPAPLEPEPLPSRIGMIGKAILYAGTALRFPSEGPWEGELAGAPATGRLPAFADIPHAGEPIDTGHPVLTYFACGPSQDLCLANLRQRAADLDRWLLGR